ncbi:MAG: PEP-CTERM sorting domain-containing protein [Acidobacteriia bacterium]|nr:PEP-CTERM sorting domain-containing protein [Terriglobia bacterium]
MIVSLNKKVETLEDILHKFIHFPAVLALVLVFASTAWAVPVVNAQWYEFSFGAAPGATAACTALDCVPSSGGNSTFVGDPPWTYTASSLGATLIVTDAFSRLDSFEIFDSLVSQGTTGAFSGIGSCGSDPAVCVLDPDVSKGFFVLSPGAHSITIDHLTGPLGAAYFFIDDPGIPEPSTVGMVLGGLLALGFGIRRKSAQQAPPS